MPLYRCTIAKGLTTYEQRSRIAKSITKTHCDATGAPPIFVHVMFIEDEAALARLDRQLWDQEATGFVPHGISGGPDDARQPILLSTTPDAPNLARNILIADGVWRDAALAYDRAFYLFDAAAIDGARLAWKLLSGRDEVERRYWAQDDRGKWTAKA